MDYTQKSYLEVTNILSALNAPVSKRIENPEDPTAGGSCSILCQIIAKPSPELLGSIRDMIQHGDGVVRDGMTSFPDP